MTTSVPADTHPLGTAGRHASLRVPTAGPDDTVGHVLEGLRGGDFDSAAVVAILEGERLLGLVTIERLLRAPDGTRVGEIMDSAPPVVTPTVVQEQAAWRAVQHGEPTLAVIDDGRIIDLRGSEEDMRSAEDFGIDLGRRPGGDNFMDVGEF